MSNIFSNWGESSKVDVAEAQPVFAESKFVVYNETLETNIMKRIPTSGNSGDLTSLLDDEERTDFLHWMGFNCLILWIPFLVWTFLLIKWKMDIFQRKSCIDVNGSVSGKPFRCTSPKGTSMYAKWVGHVCRIRVTFIIAASLVAVIAIIPLANGMGNLERITRDILPEVITGIDDFVDDAVVVSDSLQQILQRARQIKQNELLFIADGDSKQVDLCPQAEPGNPVLPVLQGAQRWLKFVEDIITFIDESAQEEIERLPTITESTRSVSSSVSNMVGNTQKWFWTWQIFQIAVVLISFTMIVGTCMANQKIMAEPVVILVSYFFLPLFISFIALSCLVSSIMLPLSISNAKFCSPNDGGINGDTPDSSILMLASDRFDLDVTSYPYQVIRYYVHQCTADAQVDPFLYLRNFNAQVTASRTDAATMQNSLNFNLLSAVCGRDFSPLENLLVDVQDVLGVLSHVSIRTLNIVDCERIAPLYTTAVYDGVCDSLVVGNTWIFGSLLGISIMGMIMITFRSSYLNSIVLPDSKSEDHSQEESVVTYEIV